MKIVFITESSGNNFEIWSLKFGDGVFHRKVWDTAAVKPMNGSDSDNFDCSVRDNPRDFVDLAILG